MLERCNFLSDAGLEQLKRISCWSLVNLTDVYSTLIGQGLEDLMVKE